MTLAQADCDGSATGAEEQCELRKIEGREPEEDTAFVKKSWWAGDRKEWLSYNQAKDKIFCVACRKYLDLYTRRNPKCHKSTEFRDGFNLEDENKNRRKIYDHTEADRGKSHAAYVNRFWSVAHDGDHTMTMAASRHQKWVESTFIVTVKLSHDGI
ncbi:hypothetical protein RvY_01229-1 [Ramazzottius varieornatus]|uniref:Uncharacterized protein n=1 Tax=Ramazzottius varieornatus TaxID=947166 RepID=A0A1D1UMQ6_RAMVA|nr:hypothetical protein RvY_01229-1 [Ramazzottius varieornatus]